LRRIAPCLASSHILKNGRCEIHAEAPYGCAYFSAEQSREEADAISARGLQEIAKAWRRGDLYAQLWLMLYHSCPSPKLDSSALSTTSLVFLATKIFEIKI